MLDTLHQQVARVLDVRHMVVLLQTRTRDALEVVLRDRRRAARSTSEPRRYPATPAGLMTVVLESGRPLRDAPTTGASARGAGCRRCRPRAAAATGSACR